MPHPEVQDPTQPGYFMRFVPATPFNRALGRSPIGARLAVAAVGVCFITFAGGAYLGKQDAASSLDRLSTQLSQTKTELTAAQKAAEQNQQRVQKIQKCVMEASQ